MIVAHLDLDAFYAAVEQLESPELRTQPLVVGGDPRGRGVVATANYVARRFGMEPPARVSKAEAATLLGSAALSFMRESRRLSNRRLREELRVALRYPRVEDALPR